MILYVKFDAEGRAAAVYESPREDAEAVEDLDLEFLIEHRRLPDGSWVVREAEVVPEPTAEELAAQLQAELVATKQAAMEALLAAISSIRAMIYTTLPGQDAIYLQKRIEASRYLDLDAEPTSLEGFPFLTAEVGVTADNAYELSQIWLNRGYLFETYGALTEGLRMRTSQAIQTATTTEQVRQAELAFQASIEAHFPT